MPGNLRENGNITLFTIGAGIANKELKQGIFAEFAGMKPIGPKTYLGFSGGYGKSENKVATLSKGDVKALPLLLRFRAETSREAPIGWFLDLGAGYCLFKHTLDSELKNILSQNNFDLEEDISNAFIWTTGVGVRYRASSGFDLSLGFARYIMRTKYTVHLWDRSTWDLFYERGGIDLSSSVLHITAIIRFGKKPD